MMMTMMMMMMMMMIMMTMMIIIIILLLLLLPSLLLSLSLLRQWSWTGHTISTSSPSITGHVLGYGGKDVAVVCWLLNVPATC